MYKVIKYFIDLHDGNHPYNEGDVFPRKGITVTDERIAELAGSNNKQGVPLIAPVAASAKKAAKKIEKPAEAAEIAEPTE